MTEDPGRCINCGFYGKQLRDETLSICYEATPTDRQTGRVSDFEGVRQVRPSCFRNKTDYGWNPYKPLTEAELLARISEDRKCSFWYRYTQYCSPKEHYEEFKMLELERRRDEFEQRMEKERKEFELRLDERNREERKRTDKVMKWLATAAIIFALAEVVAAILGITSDAWILRLIRR